MQYHPNEKKFNNLFASGEDLQSTTKESTDTSSLYGKSTLKSILKVTDYTRKCAIYNRAPTKFLC